jgi:hypothetical protein
MRLDYLLFRFAVLLQYHEQHIYQVSRNSGAIGELGYLEKIWKNVKREKLLQIMCFQSQVFEFCI